MAVGPDQLPGHHAMDDPMHIRLGHHGILGYGCLTLEQILTNNPELCEASEASWKDSLVLIAAYVRLLAMGAPGQHCAAQLQTTATMVVHSHAAQPLFSAGTLADSLQEVNCPAGTTGHIQLSNVWAPAIVHFTRVALQYMQRQKERGVKEPTPLAPCVPTALMAQRHLGMLQDVQQQQCKLMAPQQQEELQLQIQQLELLVTKLQELPRQASCTPARLVRKLLRVKESVIRKVEQQQQQQQQPCPCSHATSQVSADMQAHPAATAHAAPQLPHEGSGAGQGLEVQRVSKDMAGQPAAQVPSHEGAVQPTSAQPPHTPATAGAVSAQTQQQQQQSWLHWQGQFSRKDLLAPSKLLETELVTGSNLTMIPGSACVGSAKGGLQHGHVQAVQQVVQPCAASEITQSQDPLTQVEEQPEQLQGLTSHSHTAGYAALVRIKGGMMAAPPRRFLRGPSLKESSLPAGSVTAHQDCATTPTPAPAHPLPSPLPSTSLRAPAATGLPQAAQQEHALQLSMGPAAGGSHAESSQSAASSSDMSSGSSAQCTDISSTGSSTELSESDDDAGLAVFHKRLISMDSITSCKSAQVPTSCYILRVAADKSLHQLAAEAALNNKARSYRRRTSPTIVTRSRGWSTGRHTALSVQGYSHAGPCNMDQGVIQANDTPSLLDSTPQQPLTPFPIDVPANFVEDDADQSDWPAQSPQHTHARHSQGGLVQGGAVPASGVVCETLHYSSSQATSHGAALAQPQEPASPSFTPDVSEQGQQQQCPGCLKGVAVAGSMTCVMLVEGFQLLRGARRLLGR